MQEKARRQKLTPLPMPKHAIPVQMSPTDESLPAKIKESIRDSNVEAVVFRDKNDYVKQTILLLTKKLMKTRNLFVMKFLFSTNYA